MTPKKSIGWGMPAFFFLLLAGIGMAAEPTMVALQGKLTNSSTGAIINSAILRVNISDQSGITVWNQTYTNAVSAGFFDLLLGADAGNPLNLTFNKDYNVSVYAGSSSTPIGGSYKFRSSVGSVSLSNLTSGNFSAEGNYSFGSTLFVDKTNGNVGIGTTSPQSNLDVHGTNTAVYVSDTSSSTFYGLLNLNSVANTFYVRGNGASLQLGTMNAGGSVTITPNAVVAATFTTGGLVGIGTTSPATVLDVKGKANFTGNFSIGETSNIFFVDNTSGNVGIGTAGPDTKLTITNTSSGKVTNVLKLINEGGAANTGTAIVFADNTIGLNYVDARIVGYADGTSPYGGVLQFETNDADDATAAVRMTIDSSGNVGIAQTSPNVTLGVSGSANITGAVSFPSLANCDTINTDAAGLLSCGTDATGSVTAGTALNVTNLNASGQVLLATDGVSKVGIGTTTPTVKLQVIDRQGDGAGTIAATASMRNISEASTDAQVGVWGTTISSDTSGTNSNIWGVYGFAEQNGAGGTVSSLRGVHGATFTNTGTTDNAIALYATVSNSATLTTGYGLYISNIAGTTDYGVYQADSSDDNYFAGNVGIGTTTPGQKLHVIGSANISQNVFYGGNLTGYGADFAEMLGKAENVEAGDVVCFTDDMHVKKCRERGSKAVAGVVSTQPTIRGNANAENAVPVGIVGIVPTKVKGPVGRFDLITASAIAGYGEKASQNDFGGILGKAMEPCEKECIISVLVGLG